MSQFIDVQVCSSWRHAIINCPPYWKVQYFKLHKTIVSKETSFQELTIKTLKFESYLQKLQPISTISHPQKRDECYIPIGSSFNWFHDVNMQFIEYCSSLLSEPFSFKVNTADIDRGMRVLWSWSTTNCGIFYGNNGTWTLISYPVIHSSLPLHPPLQTKVWQDDICSPSHYVLGGCPDCHLVVRLVKHINQEDGTWTVAVVKLTDRLADQVDVEKLQFHFVPDPELLTSALFTVRSVRLYPSVGTVQVPFCVRHQLWIQIGIGIVTLKLVCNEHFAFELSEISHSLCPEGFSWSDDGNPSCSGFVVSRDRNLVAIMPQENFLSVWNLKDVCSYSHLISSHNLKSSVNKMLVVSVGQLYSVVCSVSQGNINLLFLSTSTGRRVSETNLILTDVCDVSSTCLDISLDELWTINKYSCCLMCVYHPSKMVSSFIQSVARCIL